MDVKTIDLHDLIVLQKNEIHFSILEKCFSSYIDMVKCRNTVFVVDEKNAFVGIITLSDYKKCLQQNKLEINSGCKKIVSENPNEALAQAFLIKQQYDFVKILPVVDLENKLCYAISIEDRNSSTKNIRDFSYWIERNSKAIEQIYQKEDKICICASDPFEAIYVARLCKRYLLNDIGLMILGENDYVIRNNTMLEEVSLVTEEDIEKYTHIITIDVDLYRLKCQSILQLIQIMSESTKVNHNTSEDPRELIWLHIGDLLTPCNGQITGVQFFIISRVLDIERRKENLPFYWQNRFNEYFWPLMTKQEEKEMEAKFDLLINSLKERGFNPNVNAASITDCPIGLNDGAHRTAWHVVYSPNYYIPCYLGNRSLTSSFWPLHGEKLFTKVGLPNEELMILKNRYNQMIENDEIRTSLTGYVKEIYFDSLILLISQYGEVISTTRIRQDNEVIVVFRIKMFWQWIYYKNKRIKSKYIESMQRKMRILYGNDWGSIADTVTSSIELENEIEGKFLQKLQFIGEVKKEK